MQFSLFDKRPLFDPDTLQRRRSEWRQAAVEGLSLSSRSVDQFVREMRTARKGSTKETALEQAFNAAFFVELLGYTLYPGSDGRWTAWPKPPSSATGLVGEPDVILGRDNGGTFDINTVVELKKPQVSLDAPQAGYGNRTPVEQAFDYARKLATCRWVIVSNMRLVRLYSIETPDAFHEIDLWSDGTDGLSAVSEAYHLLAYSHLVAHGPDSATARLLAAAQTKQASFREGFYALYSEIRADLLEALEAWSDGQHPREELVGAVQRLLDRLLFIYFCEDHPDRLLRNDLVRGVVSRAVEQPGTAITKAYEALKQLFRDLDVGAQTPFWQVPRYNGELFKPHDVVDRAELPDSLHAKTYGWVSPGSRTRRTVEGVYGLHVFDFWRELDRDLLGNLFERSLGDLTALSHGGRPDARAAFGVFYTAGRLARFAARSAVAATLEADTELTALLASIVRLKGSEQLAVVGQVVERLKSYRIADLACGSGVFLTAALDALLQPYRKALEALQVGAMETDLYSHRQAEVLKASIYGEDLLPQAVELAKLSLWLTAARRNEPSADLSSNFVAGDTLQAENLRRLMQSAGGYFDLIVGNPPWGAEIDATRAAELAAEAGFPVRDGLDSWEVFLCVVMSALKEGGRFALILPDTIFSANKDQTRAWLLRSAKLEKFYSLGPDWFTNSVRMGTVFVQGVRVSDRNANLLADHDLVRTLVLAGVERQEAQQGRRPLEQLEQVGSGLTPQARMVEHPQSQIQVLASIEDLDLIARMEVRSEPLSSLTHHARGDEINSEGLLWSCRGCNHFTVPGEKAKGGGYKSKSCPSCGANLTAADVADFNLVSPIQRGAYTQPFIDGTTLTARYGSPVRQYIRTDLNNMTPPLKPARLYEGSKILIRQAGVGITATLIADGSRCPQSVYLYWSTPEAIECGYSNEFILACLVSRTMNFYSMKKFGEVDPARAFAKLTHSRLANFPIPLLTTPADKAKAERIVSATRSMLTTQAYGGEEDYLIERELRSLWGITGDEGRYINGFFSVLPPGQAVVDLFPHGAPTRVPFPRAA